MTRPNAIEMKPRSAPENGAFVPPSSSRIAGTEPAPMKTSSPVPMNSATARCAAEYSCIETYTSFRPTAERAAGRSAGSPSVVTREPCSIMSNIVRRNVTTRARRVKVAARLVDDQSVPVDRFDLRRPGLELDGVDRADPAPERSPVEAAELDAVAGAEGSLGADDADGEQAPAVADDRPAGAVVDVDAAADALAEAKPELERRLACGGGLEARAERLARQDLRQHVVPRPGRDHDRDPRGRRHLRGGHLAADPASSDLGRSPEDGGTGVRAVRDQLRPRVAGRMREDALDARQKDEQPRAHEDRGLRGQRVVVAESDLVRGSRVVLVHDRDGVEREERPERIAYVHVRPPVGDLGGGQQHLARGQAVCAERVLPHALERRLPDGGRRLKARQAARTALESHLPQTDRDRARRDDADRYAGRDDLRDLSRTREQQLPPRLAVPVDHEARPELDDERAVHRLCVASPTTTYWRSQRSR